jgi:uncharacterized protein (TIGR03083 family)
MKTTEIWAHIHAERSDLADTLGTLGDEQWATVSWCEGWSVLETTGHVVAAAEQTFPGFYKEMALAGFRFNVFTARGASRLAEAGPDELVRRLRARTSTTNHPPAPVIAMLGEIIVHGEDIRRPLAETHHSPEAALVALADSWKNSNLLIGAKRRMTGLHFVASDVEWSHGQGPEVSGPLQSLILAMTGRRGSLQDLEGEGLHVLAGRT